MSVREGEPLILPRRLAIALLAEAQKAADGHAGGLIGARDGVPVAVYPAADRAAERAALEGMRDRGQTPWAVFRTEAASRQPTDGGNSGLPELVISLDTKGVLQLRCPAGGGQSGPEREVRIAES